MQKKIQQNVALKSKNQILSIKKFILTISSEDGKGRRPRMEEKSGGQLASGMKAISLSTLQRKTGGHRQGLPCYLRKHCVQLSAVQQANFPTEAARVLAGNPVPPSFPGSTPPFLQQEGRVVVKVRASEQAHGKG